MEHYRVVVEYVNRNGLNQNSTLYHQVAACHTETFDLEVKSVLHVARVALNALREKHPNATMTSFTCERITEGGKPKHPHAQLIRELRREDKAALEDCAWNGELFGSSVHWSVLDKLGLHQLIEQHIPKHGKVRFVLTTKGREVAAALGFTAGGEA